MRRVPELTASTIVDLELRSMRSRGATPLLHSARASRRGRGVVFSPAQSCGSPGECSSGGPVTAPHTTLLTALDNNVGLLKHVIDCLLSAQRYYEYSSFSSFPFESFHPESKAPLSYKWRVRRYSYSYFVATEMVNTTQRLLIRHVLFSRPRGLLLVSGAQDSVVIPLLIIRRIGVPEQAQ